MRAVVFDLFGTLTDPAAEVGRSDVFRRTAEALGVDAELYTQHLVDTYADRITGRTGDTRSFVAAGARACGVEVDAETLARAAEVHRAGAQALRRPRPGALDVLAELRRRGFRIGLLSDCSSEVAEGWAASQYASLIDARVLSYEEGCRKPDPRLYGAIADRLGVAPNECWYVGDGGGRELTGATMAGMTPVLVTNAAIAGADQHRTDPDDFVAAHTVDDIVEVLDLVGAPHPAAPSAS